jgi:hypothetical protein
MAFDRLPAPPQSTGHLVDVFADEDAYDDGQGQAVEGMYDEDDGSLLDDDHEDDSNYEDQDGDVIDDDLSAEQQARWLRLLQEQHQWAHAQAQMQTQHGLGYSADELDEEDRALLARQYDIDVRPDFAGPSVDDQYAQYAQLRTQHQHESEQQRHAEQRQAARQAGGSSSSGATR